MLKLKFVDRSSEGKPGLYCPLFECDWCHRDITDADMAMYKWKSGNDRQPIPGTFVVLHKGRCDEQHNKRYDADLWGWGELTSLLGTLLNNSLPTREDSWNIWPHLVERYCPTAQLKEVERVAKQGLDYPDDRPPSLGDLSL